MKRSQGQDARKSWGRFIGLLVAFLLILESNVSTSSTPSPGKAQTISSTPPLAVSITTVAAPDYTCLLTTASAVIAVKVNDVGGTVTKVEFYDGSTLLGNSMAVPYSFTWTNPPEGSHVLTAKAYDSYNDNAVSAPVTVRVFAGCSPNPAPVVSLTSPASNSILSPPVALQANASEQDAPGSGAITRVEFYDGGALLDTATSPPYTFTWLYPASGPHTLTARAYDGAGRSTTSAAVLVTIGSTTRPTPSVTPASTPALPVTPGPLATPTPGVTPAPSVTPAPPVTPTSAGESCKVSYQLASQWSGGMEVTIVITNTGTTAINGWTLKFAFPGDQQITDLWNGNFTQTSNQVMITNASWNGTIAPNGTVNLGFNGTWTSNDRSPTAFTLNGQLCTAG
jgi:Cellulose binding domain/Bacterial Ig domain